MIRKSKIGVENMLESDGSSRLEHSKHTAALNPTLKIYIPPFSVVCKLHTTVFGGMSNIYTYLDFLKKSHVGAIFSPSLKSRISYPEVLSHPYGPRLMIDTNGISF